MPRWSIGIAVILILILAGSCVLLRPLWDNRVYAGVSVGGIHVGGTSKAELSQILTVWQQQQLNKNIMLYYGDIRYRLHPGSLDFAIDIDATVEEAWNVGRRGNLVERLKSIRSATGGGYRLPLRIRYNESKLDAQIDLWRDSIDRPFRNAALSVLTGSVMPQEQGRKLEVEVLRPLVVHALRTPEEVNLPLPVKLLEPEITVADIQQSGIRQKLASYVTVYDAADVNRTANIKLAAAKINGHLVYPGRVFSFNQIVGPRDKSHGFKEALEIVEGEFVPGIGGGVCQVSSTLYNVILMANMGVVERYNHSKPLGYVSLGRDATVAYGSIDFKFVNNTDSPVMIMAQTEENRLVIGLFGDSQPTETIEVLTLDRQVISPAVIKRQDPELYLGETMVEKQGKPGYEITTIRVVRRGDKEVKREVLAKDTYQPDNTVIKVGMKLPPFASAGP